MDSFYIRAQQLKACQKEFSPQLIPCLVVHMIKFQMCVFKSTGTTNLYKPSRMLCAEPLAICMTHVNIHALQKARNVLLVFSSCNEHEKCSAACLWGGGSESLEISRAYYEKQYYHEVHLMIASL